MRGITALSRSPDISLSEFDLFFSKQFLCRTCYNIMAELSINSTSNLTRDGTLISIMNLTSMAIQVKKIIVKSSRASSS